MVLRQVRHCRDPDAIGARDDWAVSFSTARGEPVEPPVAIGSRTLQVGLAGPFRLELLLSSQTSDHLLQKGLRLGLNRIGL